MSALKSNWGSWLSVLVLLLVIGVLSSFVVSFFRKEADEVATLVVPKMDSIAMANKMLSEAFITTLQAVLAKEQDERRALIDKVSDKSQETTEILQQYSALPLSETERRQLGELMDARSRYFATRDSVFLALTNGQQDLAWNLSQGEMRQSFSRYETLGLSILQEQGAALREHSRSVAKSATMLQVMTGTLSSALFLLAFCIGLFVGLILVPAGKMFSDAEKPSNSISLMEREDSLLARHQTER